MKNAQMPRWLKIVVAIASCAIVIISYNVLSIVLGFHNKSGNFILMILFCLLGGVWRAVVRSEGPRTIDVTLDEKCIKDVVVNSDATITNSVANISKAVCESSESEINDSQSINVDYHIVVKVLLVILMVVGVIVMIYQVANDFIWENYVVGWVRLISSLIALSGLILLYAKKLSGYFITLSIYLFSIVYSSIMHDSNLEIIVLSVFLRLLLISLLLLIRNDNISAWSILLHGHLGTINKLREIFPLKPDLYIEKHIDSQQNMNAERNFDNWLNN